MIINPYVFSSAAPDRWRGISTGDTGFGNYSLTMPGVDLGPSGNKVVWIMIGWRGNYSTTQLNSVTIAGASAARLRRVTTTSSARNLEMWYAATTAASGDVVATFSQHSVTCRASTWWGANTPPSANSDTAYSASASSRNSTVNTYADGYVMAGALWFDSGKTATWTNATELDDTTGLESFAQVADTESAAALTVTTTLNSSSAAFHHLVVAAL